ncbi:hypothetical protein ACLXNF_17180 [Mycobacteroides chelonae]|uniref:hypothetical protein n=1 Tax=Mycobacteroides chelonae TaxID=1774 RepID=UPI0039E9B98C
MSPFIPAVSTLSDLSARFQDLASALTQPTPGQGATVDAVDERHAARTITLNRLADWAYTASATAREQADVDAGLERAPSPATISALADVCHATAGNDPSALAAYQEAGAERMSAKKAHAAQTAQTTWPESITPAPMPTCGVDDRPLGDGWEGEGVEDPTQSESETPVSMSDPAGEPETPVTMSTVSDTAAGTSLSADTLTTDPAARTASLSSPTATAAQAPTAGQPSPAVTGPTGGAASQLGAPQNGVRQGAAGRRPAQTRKEDSREPARDTTFDAAVAPIAGAITGTASVSGSSAGLPSAPSTSTSGAPTATPAPPSTPPSATPPSGQGAGPMGGGPMARAMGSGNTVAPTSAASPPTILATEVDPSIDPLKADPDDLDWTPPTIPEGEKK